MPVGLAHSAVAVVEHDPAWREEFEREAARLGSLLGELVGAVEHVGSTAVPGLPAKPIIDVALGFADRPRLDRAAGLLEAAGYDQRGDQGAAGGVVFERGTEALRTHHLHLVELSDPQWRRYLAFRAILRSDAEARERYAALKRQLAVQFPTDRLGYTDGKHDFVRSLLAKAGYEAARPPRRERATATSSCGKAGPPPSSVSCASW